MRYVQMIIVGCLILVCLQGCYFFRKRGNKGSASTTAATGNYYGDAIGNTANGANAAALAALYAINTDQAPAPIRPDPDVFVRRLLLQYRAEGSTVAREIGRVEQFRMLLGGASEDFATTPQETYDATSLLANMKVAEEICQGLVAPTAALQPGWNTILPHPTTSTNANIRYLAQRFMGLPSSDLPDAAIASLTAILDGETGGASPQLTHYVPVCVALVLDAQSLLL